MLCIFARAHTRQQMPAYRLFIEPSGENKGHYKLRVVSLPLSTAISGVALTLSAQNYTVDLSVLARALFFFQSGLFGEGPSICFDVSIGCSVGVCVPV